MRFLIGLPALLAVLLPFHVQAQTRDAPPVRAITPIFSQLVLLSYPSGFRPASENSANGYYIQESVRAGETVEKWTQMLTVTGNKDLVPAAASLTPELYASKVAEGFHKQCPASFTAVGLGEVKLDAHDAYVAVVGCGSTPGNAHSETMLLVAIRGERDYYSVQWAERGKASAQPLPVDEAKWVQRFKQIMPIRLCPIVPGEKAPFPSCANRG